ncbi:hypothetical protein ACGFI9_35185 [Micromonospora sp. NPDC048930]|uniref:hypothetical protein n=1 Tax=Micromonospora sp. NPDC048930 TaxID=3364261 RepID=UPI00371DCBB9
MRRITLAGSALALALLALAGPLAGTSAYAHDERPTRTLDGSGSVPTYRTDGPTLLVCKSNKADFDRRIAGFPADLKATNEALWADCQRSGYRHLQSAVDAVTLPGTNIKMLPGLYQEEPSLEPVTGPCAALNGIRKSALYQYDVLTLQQQIACPHNQNLVGIFNKKNLQIEGTGAAPTDVIVDAQYKKLNTIRADNSDGVYLKNLTAERSQFNAFYIMETDGFVVDHAVGRWNDEYGFLTFAVDHGLYTEVEGYGNGDSAFYPGAASNINKDRGYDVPRYAVEIRNSYGHHNMLGYSGTAGDSVWVHDNVFTHNSTGISTDSAFPDHPGMPQNHSTFERNIIADNNSDYYRYAKDGTCHKPYEERGYENGVVCPVVGVPVGNGVINPGGNYNIWRDNHIYGNQRYGFVTSWVPGFVRNDTGLAEQFDTSHHNRYLNNHMGISEKGAASPNGVDYWWDGQGVDNCWTTATDSVDVSSNIGILPECGDDELPTPWGTKRYLGEPLGVAKMYTCAQYSLQSDKMPVDCDWWGAYGARDFERVEVRVALGGAVILAASVLLTWVRRLRRSPLGAFAVLATVAGLAVGVFGTLKYGARLDALGLGLAGIGWLSLGLGLRRVGRTKLGVLSLLIAVFSVLGAIDHGVVPIPFIPAAPSLFRLVLEIIWVPSALVSLFLHNRRAPAETAEEQAPQKPAPARQA